MNDFGIIGVGRIGTSMARNMSSKGIQVSLYDKNFIKSDNDLSNVYPELKSSLISGKTSSSTRCTFTVKSTFLPASSSA